MVRIRLRRVGSKGQPSYRVVAADKESPRDGRFLEILGFYNPRTHPATIQLKEDRIFEWMGNGAQPTESVAQIFKIAGVFERFERFKQGESLDVLLKEATQAELLRNTSLKTRFIAQPQKAEKSVETKKAETPEEPKKAAKAEKALKPEKIEEPQTEPEAETSVAMEVEPQTESTEQIEEQDQLMDVAESKQDEEVEEVESVDEEKAED